LFFIILLLYTEKDRVRAKIERDILARAEHTFIVPCYYGNVFTEKSFNILSSIICAAFQTDCTLYLVLEFARGGDLFGRFEQKVC
jgi:hypothetical protein